ncbi:MFS transporter, CP family, cyanate transporter [Agromyces sp. CF514]|uniref:MFS transporter n=1 Tax=Agromyces sp. CF514 TaxID=1881031 RepID=UPI0008F12057|nr:MFS transporter [Agromyces sp. CF514]SFR87742.1 MFS transporter, CP family, cyanate transporter [Agromyces sp. CF514]
MTGAIPAIPTGEPARPLWAGRTLALLGILLVASSLRTGVASLSPIIAEIDADIPLPPALVGLLGMLPPLCFAVFGILTPMIAKRLGLERTVVVALAVLAAGLLGRGLAPEAVTLVGASVLVFAAVGVGNVLLPPLVKRYFSDRVGLVTTLYVSIISVSTFVPPLLAVPVADAAGWRVSLGEWALVAVVALVPWIALLVHPRAGAPAAMPEEAAGGQVRRALRSPIAWALATIFAVSSVNAYVMFAWLPRIVVDVAGVTSAQAGALLSLFAAMGLPAALLVPVVAARYDRVRTLVVISVLAFLLGYGGLLLAPESAIWLWVALIGTGPLLFPLALVLINLRTRTHDGSIALSGVVQSVGYLIAAVAPIGIGLVHEATGGWTLPLVLLAATAVPAAIAGFLAARPGYLEDDHRARRV